MLTRLRLYSAIVMGVFVFSHLSNLSLAIVSGTLMDWGMTFSIDPWRTVPGTVLLAGAFLVHFSLAFWAIYRRKTLRLHGWEIPQNILGFLIPLLLIYHLMETRLAHEFWGVAGDYTSQLLLFWHLAPAWCAGQILLLIVAWVHCYVGFHTWLRLRPWYAAYRPLISGFFVVLPTLALAGFVSGGMQTRDMVPENPEEAAAAIWEWRADWGLTEEVYDSVVRYTFICMAGYVGLIAGVLLVRQTRLSFLSRSRGSRVVYNGKVALRVLPGDSVLEALRAAGVRHASVCGGRARCSTCRIRVTNGLELLKPPSQAEQDVLVRISAPPAVRLACQLRPTADLEVISLLAPSVGPEAAFASPSQGEELELAVLFCDLREFTRLAEEKLPYDVVFVLNRYFEAMGGAIEESGGRIDKFIGDGVMALFGIRGRASQGCTQALSAAHLMATKLEDLNSALDNDLERPLEVGIGIEVGRVIVGEMGYGRSKSLTAIGDCVNTASRFQELCKEFDCQLVVSVEATSRSRFDLSSFPRREVRVRGRSEIREVYTIESALHLQPLDLQPMIAGR
jgi:adenylate cyclase